MKATKKKKISFLWTVIGILSISFMGSCSNENFEDLNQNQEIADKTVDIAGKIIAIEGEVLSFENEADLESLLLDIRNQEKTRTRMASSSDFYFEPTRATITIKGFKSLYDIYEEALYEAESYYERDGGYEEFKAKYDMLYYPEEGSDYGAYLPVSDDNLAKLLNKDGEVIIGGTKKNMKDVSTYEQLEKLGKTFPDVEPTEENTINLNTLQSNIRWVDQGELVYNTKRNRRFEVRTTSQILRYGDIWEVDITTKMSFRAKNFVGIWYNYNQRGIVGMGPRPVDAPVPAEGDPNFGFRYGLSSLYFPVHLKFDARVGYPVSVVQSAWFASVGIWVSYESL